MFKKIILLSSTLFLIGCQMDTTEETSEEDPAPTETEVEETETPTDPDDTDIEDPDAHEDTGEYTYTTQQFANLIEEENFEDANVVQAWEDYQEVVFNATYSEATALYQDTTEDSEQDGSSPEEVEELMSASDLYDEVDVEQVEVNETDIFHFYRYPMEEDSDNGEEADYIVELAFYYVDNHLAFSSITPYNYDLDTEDLPTTEMLVNLENIPEMGSLELDVLTVADMKINDNLIHQIMVPSATEDDEPSEETMAFYYFIHGEDVIYYDILPYAIVSDNLTDQSVSLFEQVAPEIAEMDFDEAI